MEELFQKEWIGLLFGVISFVLLGVLGGISANFKKQINEYKELLEQKEKEQFGDMIDEKLIPIVTELDRLNKRCEEVDGKHEADMGVILESYRYRLIQLCHLYLIQGYMTNEQFQQLTEFYKVYTGLGGNGQAHDYYNKASKLPIRN